MHLNDRGLTDNKHKQDNESAHVNDFASQLVSMKASFCQNCKMWKAVIRVEI